MPLQRRLPKRGFTNIFKKHFALVNLSRWHGFSAEHALQRASDKFARRFAAVEASCRARGAKPEELTLEQLDGFWNDAKAAERRGS